MHSIIHRFLAALLSFAFLLGHPGAVSLAHEQETKDQKQDGDDKKSTGFEDTINHDHDTIKADSKVEQSTTGNTTPAKNNALPRLPQYDPNAPAPALPAGVPAEAATPVESATGASVGGLDLNSLASMAKSAMTGMAMVQALPMLGGLVQSVAGMFTGGGPSTGSSQAQTAVMPPQLQYMPSPDASSYAAARGSTANILYVPLPAQDLDATTVGAVTALRQDALEKAAVDAYAVGVIGKNDAGNTSALAAKLEGCAAASTNLRTDWQCNTAGLVTQNQQTAGIVQALNHLLELRALSAISADPRMTSLTVTP